MPEVRCRGSRYFYTEQNPEGIHKVILLHPFLGSSASWQEALPCFDETFRVLGFDLRGFGNSDKSSTGCTVHALADEVRSAIHGTEIQRCSVLASGAGAAVAISLAARYPSLVFKLVLFEPNPVTLDSEPAEKATEELADIDWEKDSLAQYLGKHVCPGLPADKLAHAAEIATAADRDCAVALSRSLAKTDLYHLLGHITARTLVVVGRESSEDDRFAARLVNAAIQHSYLRTLPGCAGGLLATDPAGASEAALQLLNAWDLVGGQS